MKQKILLCLVCVGIIFIFFDNRLAGTSSAAPHTRFSDVADTHKNSEAIYYLAKKNIIKGFDDGSFQPDKKISRAAFTKIAIEVNFPKNEIENCIEQEGFAKKQFVFFPDVPAGEWFAPYVCVAKKNGIISGFPDGTFGPEKNIAFPAAAKILVESAGLKVAPEEPWYKPYIQTLSERKTIPPGITHLNYRITRADMAELVWRLKENIINKSYATASAIINNRCTYFDLQNIPKVNMDTVRNTWLSWYNEKRKAAGLPEYRLNDQLNRTATLWSEYSSQIGKMSHKRIGQTAYYDYGIITNWFRNLEVEFSNKSGVTYSENIGYGHWNCGESDCAQKMIRAIQTTFDFYLGEKNQKSRPHYDAIYNPFFTMMGIGIAVDEKRNLYYITTHFASGLSHTPPELCQ